jgi:hypothetical protein
MFELVSEHVFPFLRAMGGDDSTYAHHMRDARFTIPTPNLLGKAVDLIDRRLDGDPALYQDELWRNGQRLVL